MHGDPQDHATRRYVVFGHKDRLGAAVEREFTERGIRVEHVEDGDVRSTLRGAATGCFLALDHDHEANVRAALAASEVAPELPIVIRAFDPDLADEIECDVPGEDAGLRIRRAYSVAHLAAPYFVAAALLDEDEENVVTLRLGDEYVNVCQMRVRRAPRGRVGRGGRLAGRTPAKVLKDLGCQVLFRRWPPGDWRIPGEDSLRDGEEVLLGGRLHDVLDIAWRQKLHRPSGAGRPARSGDGRRRLATAWWNLKGARSYLTTPTGLVLAVLFALVSAAVVLTPPKGPAGAFHLWVATALGNTDPGESPDKLHAFAGGIGLLAGGIALGLGISLMSAHFIDRRLEEAMRQRARRARNHVVVVGTDEVGLRIAQLLDELGVPCVVLDTESDTEQQSRRRGHRLKRSPVIPGQLAAGLREAGVDRATSLIAASESNMRNIEACLRAKRDGAEQIRTIARLFNHEGDELDVARSARAFRVDRAMAAVGAAAPAFVDAALIDESMRWFESGGHAMSALRWPCGEPVGRRQMQRWHDEGVRLLAVRREGEAVRRPASEVPGLREDETGILAGPEAAVIAVLGELRGRAPSAAAPRLRAVS